MVSTPHRYSSPQSRPSAVHSGSPSKSKNRSPLSASGSTISGCASTSSYGGLPATRSRDLQLGLRRQRGDGPGRQLGHRTLVCGQVPHGQDVRVDQPGPLADPHAGDQQKVVVCADLGCAFGAPEAGADVLVLPRHRRASGKVPVEQGLQRGPARPVHRQQFVDGIADCGAVAQHQIHLGGHRHARIRQRLGVGRQLQQRLDLDRARELGVAQPVARTVAPPVRGNRRTRRNDRRTSPPDR